MHVFSVGASIGVGGMVAVYSATGAVCSATKKRLVGNAGDGDVDDGHADFNDTYDVKRCLAELVHQRKAARVARAAALNGKYSPSTHLRQLRRAAMMHTDV